ncbi:MAG: hypothetical protein ACHQYQ_01670 [Bacteriovoracales bacterium]
MDRFSEIGLVEKSLKRCLAREGFLAQFYFELSNIHPTCFDYLESQDIEEHKENLNGMLIFLINFGKGQKKGISVQENLEMGLSKETSQYWEQALLNAIATNDEELDQETSGAWRSLIKNALEFLLSQKKLKKAA